jgi:hypothetical protein
MRTVDRLCPLPTELLAVVTGFIASGEVMALLLTVKQISTDIKDKHYRKFYETRCPLDTSTPLDLVRGVLR